MSREPIPAEVKLKECRLIGVVTSDGAFELRTASSPEDLYLAAP